MKLSNFLAMSVGAIGLVTWAVGCGDGISGADTTASCDNKCFLAKYSDADWATAELPANVIDFDVYKSASAAFSTSPDHFSFFSTKATGGALDGKASGKTKIKLTFEAGKPYVIKFRNLGSAASPTVIKGDGSSGALSTVNDSQEHYFTSPDFYKSIVVKKLVTAAATYYVPYLNDFELNSPSKNGSNVTTEALLYFVPVKPGTYVMTCKEGKWNNGPHSSLTAQLGMYADIEITGPDLSVPFSVPSDFPTELGYLPETADALPAAGTAVPTLLLKKINYAANPASTISAPCASSNYNPFWWNITLGEGSGAVTWTAAKGDGSPGTSITAHDGSSNTTSGSCGSEFGYVWRIAKAGTPTAAYTLSSDIFKTIALRKIHDQQAQIKPYYVEKIEFNTNASANNSDLTKPGVGQVDLYFMPTKVGSYNMNFSLGTASSTSAGSVSVVAE